MATRTDNLKLSKAETSDAIKSTLIANNQNFDKLDGIITRLKNNQLQGTASGTEIIVQDSAEMESTLHISGNSEQDSRSGKNIFDYKNTVITSTYGLKNVLNADGTITTTGIPTVTYNGITNAVDITDLLEDGETYTLCQNAQTQNVYIQVSAAKTDGSGSVYYIVQPNTKTRTFVVDKKTYKTYKANILTGTDVTIQRNFTSGYMVVKGSYTDDNSPDFEPYGVKPSPEFESPIMSVKSKSDNLFDKSTINIIDKVYIGSTGVVSAEGASKVFYVEVTPNTTYTFSKISSYRFRMAQFTNKPISGSAGTDVIDKENDTEFSFTTKATTNYIAVWYYNSTSDTVSEQEILNSIMLNKGTVALPYQPYGYVPVVASVEGRNLVERIYNFANTSVVDGVCSQTHTDTYTDLVWKAHAYQGNTVGESLYYQTRNGLGVKSFTFWKKSNFNRIRFGLNGSVKDTLVIMDVGHLEDGEYTFQWNVLNNTQGSISWNNIQINRGAIVEPYEPYKGKTISLPLGDIELRSTPDGTRDTFTRVDGVWNKVEYVPTTTFVGNNDEVWNDHSGTNDSENCKMFAMQLPIANDYSNRISYCNRFKYYTNGTVQSKDVDVEGFNFNPAGLYSHYIYFKIKKSLLPTQNIAGWKTWLSNNPLDVAYPVKTPTYTPITDQALISALDELEQLILHKGYNRITVTAVNGVKAYLDLTYVKDINIVLNNLTTQIASIGGAE